MDGTRCGGKIARKLEPEKGANLRREGPATYSRGCEPVRDESLFPCPGHGCDVHPRSPQEYAYRDMSVAVPVVTVPAPRRGATKAKAKGGMPKCNTFQSVERWIWDTGSGVDICGQEHAPKSGPSLVRPSSEVVSTPPMGQ